MNRCKDCGLLAVIDQQDGKTKSASDDVRNRGIHFDISGQQQIANICCGKNFDGFESREYVRRSPVGSNKADAAAFVKTYEKEIDCPHFREWDRSKTPQEHEQMSILEEVKAENARSHAKQEALNETRHQEIRADVRRRDGLIIASIVLSVLGLIVSIVLAWFNQPQP